ncbi:MAG TPA: DNA mismatch repair protein MutS, partial [Croceibacterium sp.]
MSGAPTPMMAQYLALKREAGDCLLFYRMGDFFELFFDDAKTASAVLDIALTSRGEHLGTPIPMCGVPVHSAEGYLARLIKAGCRVAIAEQVESPEEAKRRGGSKALVARDIVRFVTAGTLTEEALLEPRRANVLAAVCEVRGAYGVAACDISTGRMELEDCAPGQLGAALARLGASELVAPDEQAPSIRFADTSPVNGGGFASSDPPPFTGEVSPKATEGARSPLPEDTILRPRADFASDAGEARLKAVHGVATLDGFGTFTRAMLAAAGGLLAYLDHAGRGRLPLLLPPVARAEGGTLAMDEATRASLEIIEAQGGGRAGSLLAAVDRCVTGAGARQLAEDLAAPLAAKAEIEARLNLVHWLHDDPLLRADVRDILRALPDIGRALGRLVAGRGSPRDLGQIRDGLTEARRLHDRLHGRPDQPALLKALLPRLAGHGALTDHLARALVPTPPTERSAGGFVAEGYDAALDELRLVASNSRRAIAALEAGYRAQTGIAALKIRHNGVLGYFIEVPAGRADALMAPDSGFTHRQTMAGAVRFNSLHLHEEASRIAEAGGHALAAEEAHFETLVAEVAASRERIAATAAALARIDVAAGQAERAAEGGWSRPEIVERACLEVEGGRHPVVEAALARSGERFVSNDCRLGPHDRRWRVGGPNMGGKSTFLRQNALIVLLAQAWAVAEAIHETNRCRCLFATHYH